MTSPSAKHRKASRPRRAGRTALCGAVLILLSWSASAAALEAEHRLAVEIFPADSRLSVRDDLRVRLVGAEAEIGFFISPRAERLVVEAYGRPRGHRLKNGELRLPVEPSERGGTLDLGIRYEARFDDPLPAGPVNTDNPGYGVSGTISAAGVFLLPGAGWYPAAAGARETFHLRVKAPAGMLAVTAGENLGHREEGGAAISEWRVDHPVRGLALSAAAWRRHARRQGATTVAAYFTAENEALAPAYLEAAAGHLAFYAERFGPYPFAQFAVVENFFPTGYGFPSYTLIGGAILRLPFILETSLAHEIAHCWWGNGVFVDHAGGNWSEALATYTADYLLRERESAEAAADWRRNALGNYATLAPAAADFPLSRFQGRVDPATKAVGYDKGAMVFHMLRRTIGEEAFWGALRDLARDFLFRPAAWEDLRRLFEKRSGRSLARFFEQWTARPGAPALRLEEVRREATGGGWVVRGRLRQEEPRFALEAELVLETVDGRQTAAVKLHGAEAAFEIRGAAEPRRLAVDPDSHLLRRLDPVEIPPSVNALRSSEALVVAVGGGLPPGGGLALARQLARALGAPPAAVVPEAGLDRERLGRSDLVMVGLPADPDLLGRPPEGVELRAGGFTLFGKEHAQPGDLFFGVFPHPDAPGRVRALLLPIGLQGAERAAAKIPHYGRFGYLVFRGGQNTEKGVWPVADRPLEYRFPPGGK
jgi:hypothetical protein